jgi:anti-anti-sigma factor
MTCEFTFDGDLVTVLLRGELDAVTAPGFKRHVRRLTAFERRRVILDLAGLQLIDGRGVMTIVELCKWVRSRGGNLFLRGLHGQPLAVIKLVRLDLLLSGPASLQTFNALVA